MEPFEDARRRGLRFLLALAAGSLGMFLWRLYDFTVPGEPAEGGLDSSWLILAAICGFAAWKVRHFGSRSWLYAFLACVLVVNGIALTLFEAFMPTPSFEDSLFLRRPDAVFELMLATARDTAFRLLPMAAMIAVVLLLSKWFVLPMAASGEPSRGLEFPSNYSKSFRTRATTFLVACALGGLWGYSSGSIELSYYVPKDLGLWERLDAALPLLLGAGLVVWRKGEVLRVDDDGIRLFIFNPAVTFFHAKWPRVRHVVSVFHSRELAAIIVHYRSWPRWRFSLGIHPGRWSAGGETLAPILAAASERGIEQRAYRSPRWAPTVALTCIILGLALIPAFNAVSMSLMRSIEGDTGMAQVLDQAAGLFPLSALRIGALLLIGVGLGISSSHHRGGARPVLMAMWGQCSTFVPDGVLHWLVWIAISSIIFAIKMPLIRFEGPTVPPLWQFELAINLVIAGPLIAMLGYMAGVVLLRRRATQGSRAAAEPPSSNRSS